MMNPINLLVIVLLGFSCNTQTNGKSNIKAESNNEKLIPDSDIALKFINDYADFCIERPSIEKVWIENNQLLTDNFKSAYKNLLDSAFKADPEMGLGSDPIFDAQDYPDNGFDLVSVDNKSGLVTVKGIDWPEFILVIKLINLDNKWLVDGAGVINIPVNKRAKR